MAYDLSPEADAAALKQRRDELRLFVDDMAERVAKMPLPETYLEAERGARAVWVADRALVRMRIETLGDDPEERPLRHPPLDAASATSPANAGEEGECPAPSELEVEGEGWKMPYLMTPVRLRLRSYADRLMEATTLLEKPTCYLEGERAQRYALAADRMLGQLYEPVKVTKTAGGGRFGAEDDDMDGLPERPAHDDLEAWYAILEAKLNDLARRNAAHAGYWMNGAPYVKGEPEPETGSPFNTMEYLGDPAKFDEAKKTECLTKARAWYAETHERGWEGYSEAEKAELIARIEAEWNSGQLIRDFPPRSASWGNVSHSPPLRSGGGVMERSEMTEGATVRGTPPPSASPPPPPLRRGGEVNGPSIRVVESIFAPSGPFGQRPCGCAISAPKCKGPCPLAP